MSPVAFDTLALARNLRDRAHFTQEQAEGVAESINEVMGEQLATKADLKGEIERVEHRLELLEQRMTIKLGGLIVLAVGILLAAIRYLPPHP